MSLLAICNLLGSPVVHLAATVGEYTDAAAPVVSCGCCADPPELTGPVPTDEECFEGSDCICVGAILDRQDDSGLVALALPFAGVWTAPRLDLPPLAPPTTDPPHRGGATPPPNWLSIFASPPTTRSCDRDGVLGSFDLAIRLLPWEYGSRDLFR